MSLTLTARALDFYVHLVIDAPTLGTGKAVTACNGRGYQIALQETRGAGYFFLSTDLRSLNAWGFKPSGTG